MAKAQYQARWRHRSARKRLEVYLPVKTVSRLDALAAERGQSRAQLIGELIEQAPIEQAVHASRASTSEDLGERDPANQRQPIEPSHEAGQSHTQPPASERKRPAYKLRRPKQGEGHDWIVLVDGEPVAGVERDPKDPQGRHWRARYLERSLYFGERSLTWRWARRRRRDDAVAELLAAPEVYR